MLVITDPRETVTYFWTGDGWSSEFPDAEQFEESDYKRASMIARSKWACLVRDYGYQSEEEVSNFRKG